MIIEHVENENINFSKLAIGDIFLMGEDCTDLHLKIGQDKFFDLTNNVIYTSEEFTDGCLGKCIKVNAKLIWY